MNDYLPIAEWKAGHCLRLNEWPEDRWIEIIETNSTQIMYNSSWVDDINVVTVDNAHWWILISSKNSITESLVI